MLNVPVANKIARKQATLRRNLMGHDASTNEERSTDEQGYETTVRPGPD